MYRTTCIGLHTQDYTHGIGKIYVKKYFLVQDYPTFHFHYSCILCVSSIGYKYRTTSIGLQAQDYYKYRSNSCTTIVVQLQWYILSPMSAQVQDYTYRGKLKDPIRAVQGPMSACLKKMGKNGNQVQDSTVTTIVVMQVQESTIVVPFPL